MSTISDTVTVGPWTYVFINEATTSFIEYYRFSKITEPQSGKVGTTDGVLEVLGGPLAATEYQGGLRLYYLTAGNKVNEVGLDKAGEDSADPARGWFKGTFAKDQGSANTTRSGTFMSAGKYHDGPMIIYEQETDKNQIVINFMGGDGWVQKNIKRI